MTTTRTTVRLIFAAAITLSGMGGGPTLHPAAAAEVARVGSHSIDRGDLEGAVRAIYGADITLDRLDEARRAAALEALIAAALLQLEAERRELHLTDGFTSYLDSLERALLVEHIYERDVWPSQRPSDDRQVQALYSEWGHGEQIHVPHILRRTERDARQILQQLKDGADFAGLARERSTHTMSAVQGGSMGYLRRGQLPKPIAEAVWEAEVGSLHPEPIQTSMGWHVVRVDDRRTVDLETQRALIDGELRRREKARVENGFRRRLAADFELRYHAATAAAVASLQDTIAGQRRLFDWRGGGLDLASFLARAQVPDPVTADTSRMRRIAEEIVYADLAVLAARERGYDDDPSVRRRLQLAREQQLSESLFQDETARPASPAELETHYERNKHRYRGPEQVTIREILVDEAAQADSLHRLIQQGHDMADLARRYTVRSDLRETGGLWESVKRGDPRSAKIHRLASQGQLGLRPPLKVPGGVSVFEVLKRDPGVVLSFADSEATVRQEMASQAMERLIGRLRQEFADEIQIHVE